MAVRTETISAGEFRNIPERVVGVRAESILVDFVVTGSPTLVQSTLGTITNTGGSNYRINYSQTTRGTTTVTITATWSGGRTMSRTIRFAVPVIELNYLDTFTTAELAAFKQAEDRWAHILPTALPAVSTSFDSNLTGVRVNVSKDATLSGTGALATGAPVGWRSGTLLAAEGNVKLNPDILTGGSSIPTGPRSPYTNADLQAALWHDLIMHEVFHVLAFTEFPLTDKSLATAGNCGISLLGQYAGTGSAVAAYNAVYGRAVSTVPMECSTAHWDAGVNFYPAMWPVSLAVLNEYGYPVDLTSPLWQRWEEVL